MKPSIISLRKSFTDRILLCLDRQGLIVSASAIFILFCDPTRTFGQGTMTFTFEGQPWGSTGGTSVYTESGMRFLDPSGPQQLIRNGGGLSWAPDDGTAYIQSISGGIAFTFTSGAIFDLLSFDAAGYSTNSPGPVTLELVGYGSMGLRVTNYIAVASFLDRRDSQLPDFQTFSPGSQFVDLYRVDILADHWSLDNVVIGGVPEPSTTTLALLEAAWAFGFRRLCRRRHA
jgi:hypothetical protein